MRGTSCRAYYANVDPEDIATRDPASLAAAALSHLQFARQRRGRALVRVFNPTLREHGYSSPHTVIEMVNDDMPFLVDSIGVALAQRASRCISWRIRSSRSPATTPACCARSMSAAPRPPSISGSSRSSTSKSTESSIRRCSQSLCAEIERSMRDVRVCCADWAKMRAAARQTADDLTSLQHALRSARCERNAGAARVDGRPAFYVPGLQGIPPAQPQGSRRLESVDSTGLGILRKGHKRAQSTSRTLARRHSPPEPLCATWRW